MCLTKKYQYLYLKEKINHKHTQDEYSNLNIEYWDNMGTGLCEEHRIEADDENFKNAIRTRRLKEWLDKINKKYNYI